MLDFIVPTPANYTEFLRDYLAHGNTLPVELADMDEVFNCDFTNLFKEYYLMHEIGFDTEELFTQKLHVQCMCMLPYYKDKAEALKTLFNDIFENGFSITQTNNLTNAIINDKNINIDFTTPAGLTDKILPASAMSGGSENTRNATNTNTGTITTLYSKNPKYNSYEALEKFQNNFTNIVRECLESFACMFMEIY